MLQHIAGRGPELNEERAGKRRLDKWIGLITLSAALAGGTCQSAAAATLCVNPGGTSGCFATIGGAIAAASSRDDIRVAPGTYKEDVVIGKALSLVGANASNTIIDATGKSNGIYIDGLDNPGLSNVLVTGFTIENANFEGALFTNTSSSFFYANRVINNDKGLLISSSGTSCPGQPPFETSEGDDCGEGIHLMGVDHTTIANNVSQGNSGGILLSDETLATHDNLITGNTVVNNPYDCGITMASHPPASGSTPLGITHNTIANNTSSHNGFLVPGAGAGVGIFAALPGGIVTGNVVINNQLTNNGLPGVAFHAHAPGESLNDNMIIGNTISGNGPDTEDAATPGPTGINVFGVSPITGTIISQNVIDSEMIDIVVNTPVEVLANLNNFLDAQFGIDNIGTSTVNAPENWWGCVGGPAVAGCAMSGGTKVFFAPWLTAPF
jgi:parallel beta-helix repeat protein